ncbi:MAG: hypothetical protein ACK559_22655, partial [bacterium]
MVVTLKSGTKIKLEKNQTVNIKIISSDKSEGEKFMIASDKIGNVTFMQMIQGMEKRQKEAGRQAYKYNALKNNCQQFVLDLVNGIGINEPSIN